MSTSEASQIFMATLYSMVVPVAFLVWGWFYDRSKVAKKEARS